MLYHDVLVMEIVKKGYEQQLTAHLNTIDTTGNVKFTYEEKSEGPLPFIDTLMVRKEDERSNSSCIERRHTHRPVSEL